MTENQLIEIATDNLIKIENSTLNQYVAYFNAHNADLDFSRAGVKQIVKRALYMNDDFLDNIPVILDEILHSAFDALDKKPNRIWVSVTEDTVLNDWDPDIRPVYTVEDFIGKEEYSDSF